MEKDKERKGVGMKKSTQESMVRGAAEGVVLAEQYAWKMRKTLNKEQPASNQIKKIRRELGLNQKAFAKRFGMTLHELRKMEKGGS